MTRRCRSHGFTLIEALVAVTLLALLFGALMPVFQQGLAVLRSGDHHTRAVLLAQSILDEQLALTDITDQPGSAPPASSGEFEDYRWEVRRAPFVDPPAEAASIDEAALATSAFALVEISVVVRWPDNEFGVQLHTLAIEAVQ